MAEHDKKDKGKPEVLKHYDLEDMLSLRVLKHKEAESVTGSFQNLRFIKKQKHRGTFHML